VRKTIESVLGRDRKIIVRQIIPTSRVKKVFEISFEEARRMGNNYVGTEHLLLGILIEREGIAAHVLEDLGATLHKVRIEISRLLSQEALRAEEHAAPEARPRAEPILAEDAGLAIRLARDLARAEGAAAVTAKHIQAALNHPAAEALFEITARMVALQAAKHDAIERQDYDAAAAVRIEEGKLLRNELVEAEAAWVRSLRPPKAD
jgi:ATP-dependent Clp protease ATP-binding subunit ClpA